MGLSSGLTLVLPQKFLGVIPLFIGVELVLAISILNKAGGAFGILSLLTGHPITFWQWLYNSLCILVLPFYISCLGAISKRYTNVRKMSLVCLIFVFDTFFGLLYTFYFAYVWFVHEDTNTTKRDLAIPPGKFQESYAASSQSASPARELFLTLSATIIFTVVRFYFTLVIVSFTRLLLKQYSNDPNSNLITDEEQLMFESKSTINRIRKKVFEWEMRSREILVDFFS